MSQKKEIIKIEDLQKGYLTLPIDEDQFKEFISGLLGTPQTIKKTIRGSFIVQLKDLQNFHELIEQRISQQNKGKLIQLKTQIYFSDDSSVILGSYLELISYNEIKPIWSFAVRMTWVYLIYFPDKSVPEKQEVELFINSKRDTDLLDVDYYLFGYLFENKNKQGTFKIIIRHTARSWGTDIESLLTNQIESIILKENNWKDYVKKRRFFIALISTIIFLSCSFFILDKIDGYRISKATIEVNNSLHNLGTNINKKVDYLFTYLMSDKYSEIKTTKDGYKAIAAIFIFFIGILTYRFANNEQQSFVILTRESTSRKLAYEKKRKSKGFWFIVSFAISIITGVIGCFIYQWMLNIIK